MIRVHGHSTSIMILFAVTLHLWWAAMIVLDQSALNATGPASLYRYIHHPYILVAVVAGVALSALSALFIRAQWVFLLFLPQQIILMMSATGAIEAIWLSQFADGVIRSRAFIGADQIYSVLAAVGHTMAVISHALKRLPSR